MPALSERQPSRALDAREINKIGYGKRIGDAKGVFSVLSQLMGF
jgi:hypothetical protein